MRGDGHDFVLAACFVVAGLILCVYSCAESAACRDRGGIPTSSGECAEPRKVRP